MIDWSRAVVDGVSVRAKEWLFWPVGGRGRVLDHARGDLIDTVRGLSESDAGSRLVPSLTTPITLIEHAAFAERMWFQRTFGRLADDDCDGPLWAPEDSR